MPILTSAHMRAAEQAAFARGVQVEALMDQAGAGVAQAVTKFFPKPGKCIVFAGKGHNELSAAQEIIAAEDYAGTAPQLIILDGLLGVGTRPPLREPIRAACRSINQLRTNKSAYVFAVDLPTGLDSDSGKTDRDCVI